MNVSDITGLVITFNEQENIGRVLESLRGLKRVIVLDSGSTDDTLDIVSRYDFCEVHFRPFDSFADQCNYGLSLVKTPWVLSLDADYVLSEGFLDEVSRLKLSPSIIGARARFTYCIRGKPIGGSAYPPRIVLYKPSFARYENTGHGHLLRFEGDIRELKSKIFHDDRKPLKRWLNSQHKYAELEAEYLLAATAEEWSFADKIRRRIFIMPMFISLYVLFWKRNILYGGAGIEYWLQRLYAESLISLNLMSRRIDKKQ